MSLPLSHADLVDRNGLIATIGARLAAPAFSRTEPQLPLGSEKPQALRQYGLQLRRLGSRAVPAAVTVALMAAGYSAEQISVLHMTFDAFSGRLVAASRQADR